MKLKNTLLLLVLAIGLFAFIKFYESGQVGSREARERTGQVLTIDRDNVNAVSIKNSETKIELRKDEKGGWRIVEPVKDRVDSLVLSQLFTTLEGLKADETIGTPGKGADKEQLKEFGLSNSEIKLKLSGRKESVELLFGKDTAVEGKVYVKREGDNTAYVIGKDLKEQISRKVDEFRDRKLTDLNTAQVSRVAIRTGAGEIELERQAGHWMLMKPLKARADDSKVGDFVAQVAAARIESFVGDTANVGLQEPRATISLWTDAPEPTVLHIGSNPKEEKDKEKAYAKVSTRDGVVLLPKSVEALVGTNPNDLRDRNLVRVEPDIVDRINIEGDGKEKIVLARKGESWVRKAGGRDEAINVAAARALLDRLQSQPVADFVADVATELAKYGLDRPQIKLTLSSYASENTAETKAGEKPIVSVHLGKKAEDGNVYARLEDEPFIVSVPESFPSALMTDPIQWQPLEIHRYKPEEITAIEVTRPGHGTVSLERDGEQRWKLAKGDGAASNIHVQSLVNTLATLRAVRWVGPRQPEDHFDQPTLTVTFKTSGSQGGRLLVLAEKPDDFPRGMADGLNGVFELSSPDLSAFQLPLVEKPAADAPVPAPPSAPATPAPPPQ